MPPPMSIHLPAMGSLLVTSAGWRWSSGDRSRDVVQRLLKPEHVIERETPRVIHQTMIAEQAACDIPHQHIAIRSGVRDRRGPENFVRPYHRRTGARDLDRFHRDLTS